MDLQEGPEGEAVATVLLVLAKCFGRAQLKRVWARGFRRGFPRRVLRLMLVSFSAARTIVLDGCRSNVVEVVTAIVPGSRFAMAALHIIMLEPCDLLLARWPTADGVVEQVCG